MKRQRRLPLLLVGLLSQVVFCQARGGESHVLDRLHYLNARWKCNSRQRLQEIDLSGTQVTQHDLWGLTACSQLEELNLSRTEVNDTDLTALKKLPQLKALDLAQTPITNIGVWAIKDLSRLEALSLAGTEIDDRALAFSDCLPTGIRNACSETAAA